MSAKKISWQGTSIRDDGSGYGSVHRKGYHLSIRPSSLMDDSPSDHIVETIITKAVKQSILLVDLKTPLTAGTYFVAIRDVDVDDRVSAWTNDTPFEVITSIPSKPASIEIT